MPSTTRKTIFIADLHLDKKYPDAVNAFFYYLQTLENQPIDALYILGDFFEYWLGDDCIDNMARTVAKTLSEYHSKTHTPIYFIHGNRDFLLSEPYAKQCHMSILAEHTKINLYGIQTLILHGDTLCTDDTAYMRFRDKVRSPTWQASIRKLPKWVRRLKALHMRHQSKQANQHKNQAIMDVNSQTVEAIMQQYGVTQMIHGHTHRPAQHEFSLSGQPAIRHVVGDWYEQGSVLEVSTHGARLIQLPYTQ